MVAEMGDHELHLYDLDSEVIGAAVPLAVVTLAGVGATDDVPLCINLHGGGSDRETTTRMAPFLGRGFASGRFDPMVVVTPSTGPLSWYREPWEEFIAEELPAAIAYLQFLTERQPSTVPE